MTDLAQVRFVTANYHNLQGLRGLPIAFFIIVLSGLQLVRFPAPEVVIGGVILAVMVATVMLYQWIGIYYQRTFGRVRAMQKSLLAGLLCILALLAPMSVGIFIDARWQFPLFMEGLGVAGIMVAYWWSNRRFREHYLVVGVALILLSVISPLLISHWESQSFVPVFGTIFGMLWFAISLIDHCMLLHTLAPVPEDMGHV